MMMIHGISQSNGVERQLHFVPVREGIILMVCDHKDETKRHRILLQPDDLMGTVMERVQGNTSIEGKSPSLGNKKLLDLEIKRNEVLLQIRTETATESDIAVGLDDFQDALEKAIG
ncbi:hypothetical protein BH10PLA2_BH10PLA2_33180 [soil metagenome]